jgi:hypothetical protein
MFNVDQFRLAPKHKFSFHVAFGINTGALTNVDLVQRYGSEINMLVKSIDLPSFTVQTETLNQYNRKKVMQYQHKFQELSVKFHDDNMGLINQLWQNYYSYYYADPKSAKVPGSFARNAVSNSDFITSQYGLDNASTAPFFKYIKIYQMARHEYVLYHLHNPLISSWNHNKMDYAQSGMNDFDMKLQYEAVSYDVGAVSADSPEGFGLSHYDTESSPLVGTVPSPRPSFTESANAAQSRISYLNSTISQVKLGQNTKDGLSAGGTPGLSVPNGTGKTLNGLQGFAFPLGK